MFYINDIEGQKFQGPLEKLEAWRSISRKRKTKAVAEENTTQQYKNSPNQHAITAYQKVISNNNMVEPIVHVHQIMSSSPKTISPDIPLESAWQILQDFNIHQLIVITENKKVIGMLSERDILRRLNVVDNTIILDQELVVSDVINQEFISTHSISDIRRVAIVLAQFHLAAMPVLEDEKLVGIVTRGDILRGFAANPKLNLWA